MSRRCSNQRLRRVHSAAILLLLALPAACEREEPRAIRSAQAPPDSLGDAGDTPEPPMALVDSGIPAAVAGEEGWGYSQSTEVDLDGDGEAERVVLAARVELYRGRPAWDDGQPWQVYVQESSGDRTYLYRRFVQLGTVSLRIGTPRGEEAPQVILLEQLPDRLAVYEIAYSAPGRSRITTAFVRDLDPVGETASPQLP